MDSRCSENSLSLDWLEPHLQYFGTVFSVGRKVKKDKVSLQIYTHKHKLYITIQKKQIEIV